MKERPILFSGPMIRALLAGTKTQTRRAVKPRQCPDIGCELAAGEIAGEIGKTLYRLSPYGAPGDRLWVRETWARDSEDGALFYRADVGTGNEADDWQHNIDVGASGYRWRPSIHMPRAASRITLEITGVRVERLLDISQKDCIAEGIESVDAGVWRDYGFPEPCVDGFATPRKSYLSLWEQINGPGSWYANPWVWVVEFRRVTA